MTPKLKTETRSLKHTFTPEELAKLNKDFGAAYDAVKSAEADFDAVKAVHKSKITEAESRMTTLRCTINAGFELRSEKCVVIYEPADGNKLYYLERTYDPGKALEEGRVLEPVAIEAMTEADYQQELIQAESHFEEREEIELFPPVDGDRGTLIVGRLNDRWFSALRVTIGTARLEERLDGEQPCSKWRIDQIKRALKQFTDWVEEELGREEAKGFKNAVELIKVEQAKREE